MEPDYGYLNEAVVKMMGKISSTMMNFDAALQPIFLIVGIILFVIACGKFMYQRDLAPWADFMLRYVQLMAVITATSQWQGLTNGYVDQMGAFAANAAGFDILKLAPGTVAVKGLDLAWKMYSENMSWMRVIFGSTQDTVAHLLLLLGCLGTILLCIFMASWIILFFIAFKLASVVSMIFLVFLMFDATRFMAAPGLARMLAYGVQMLVTGLVCGLFFMTLEALDLSGHLQVAQSISLLAVMLAFALLFKWTGNIAKEQISGMPSLDFHDAGRAAGAMGSMIPAMALPVLGSFAGAKMAQVGAQASGGAMSQISGPGGAGQAGIGGAPAAAVRMLERPMMDATWTEARDLPKSASRMLEAHRAALPAPSKQLPPPR